LKKKQVSGKTLTIIGFEVDPNALSITMPESAKLELLSAINKFIALTPSGKNTCHTLHEFQHIAGWSNWAFNVFLLL
jgi:hypothetical protein